MLKRFMRRQARAEAKRSGWAYIVALLIPVLIAGAGYAWTTLSDTAPDFDDLRGQVTSAISSAQSVSANAFTVERVIDGDTAVFVDESGESHRTRLIGIDAPEDTTEVEFGGPEATAYASELLPVGATVWLEVCPVRPIDRFDRKRAYIWLADPSLDSTTAEVDMLNAKMLAAGLAEVRIMDGDSSIHEDLFNRLEAEAQAAGLGMWGQ